MHLSYIISPDRRTLTIRADESARAELHEMGEEIGTNRSLWDAFEWLIANSELEWVAPEVCGDLTDAPILGIYAASPDAGKIGQSWPFAVLERWGFMSYQLRSPLQDLRDTGEAVFTAP